MTFSKNYAGEIWAYDFVQTYDLFFRTIFVFFIIELASRQVVLVSVTRSPNGAWVAQQWRRHVTLFGEGSQFLIRDNDDKFGPHFSLVTGHVDIQLPPLTEFQQFSNDTALTTLWQLHKSKKGFSTT